MHILIESHYFPCLSYFLLIKKASTIFLEENDFYKKQEYRNRCYILGSNKIQSLTIPVHSKSGIHYSEVKVDYTQNWLKIHLRSIKSAYANAPYFEYYYPLFNEVLEKQHTFLVDINREILTVCLKLLGWQNKFIEKAESKNIDMVSSIDCRNILSIKKKDTVIDEISSELRYNQLFGSKFVPNLSILDLLFNEGVKASDYFSEDAYNKMILVRQHPNI